MMKKIFYLPLLLFCLVACKKEEVKQREKFAKINFVSKNLLSFSLTYDGKASANDLKIPLGEAKFEVYDRETKAKLIDTVLNITRTETYYIVQPDLTKPPYLIINPLIDVPAAPEGYMKLSLANNTTSGLLPYESVDVVLLSNVSMLGLNYLPLDTLHGVGTGASEFFLVKKEIVGTTVQNAYKFGFINPITGARLLSFAGNEYYGVTFGADAPDNVYLIKLSTSTVSATSGPASLRNRALFLNAKYYNVNTTVDWSK